MLLNMITFNDAIVKDTIIKQGNDIEWIGTIVYGVLNENHACKSIKIHKKHKHLIYKYIKHKIGHKVNG